MAEGDCGVNLSSDSCDEAHMFVHCNCDAAGGMIWEQLVMFATFRPPACPSVSCKALTATNTPSPVTNSTGTLDTWQAG